MASFRITKGGDYSASEYLDSSFFEHGVPYNPYAAFTIGNWNNYARFIENGAIFDIFQSDAASGYQYFIPSVDGMFIDVSEHIAVVSILAGEHGDELHAGSNADFLYGLGGDDKLYGNGGNDILTGGAGSDLLEGGDGDDVLVVEDDGSADQLDGGDGIDTASFGSFTQAVRAQLGSNASYAYADVTAGMIGIENLTGGAGDDRLIGDAGANILRGGDGADLLVGNGGFGGSLEDGGADRLYGGAGDDRMVIFRDTDRVNGGDGEDAIVVADQVLVVGASTVIRNVEGFVVGNRGYLDLSARTSAVAPIYVGAGPFTQVIGSQGDDLFVVDFSNLPPPSDASSRVLAERALDAGGDPFFDGGAGFDTLDLSNGPIGFDIGLAEEGFHNFEGLIGGGYNDTLTGNEADNRVEGGLGDDYLDGGDGDDVLIGGGGFDSLVGGNGSDTASFEAALGSVEVLLRQGYAYHVFDGEGDVLTSVENVIGSDFADVITGDAAINVLAGGGGDDRLTGDFGDSLLGGMGADRMTLRATVGVNRIPEPDATPAGLIDGGDGQDVLVLRSGSFAFADATLQNVERIIVRASDVDLSGVTAGLWVTASGIDSTGLTGGTGNDRLVGGDGADTIEGGAGGDRLTGGAGGDLFVFRNASDSAAGARDLILDFSGSAGDGDRFDLSAFGEMSFVEAFSGSGTAEVRVRSSAGVQAVQVDTDGDGTLDFLVRVVSEGALTADDFVFFQPTRLAEITPFSPEHGSLEHAFANAAHPVDLTGLV